MNKFLDLDFVFVFQTSDEACLPIAVKFLSKILAFLSFLLLYSQNMWQLTHC